jgi:hypothetical protein
MTNTQAIDLFIALEDIPNCEVVSTTDDDPHDGTILAGSLLARVDAGPAAEVLEDQHTKQQFIVPAETFANKKKFMKAN